MGRNQEPGFVTQSFRLVVTALLLGVNLSPPSLYAGDILRGGAVSGNAKRGESARAAAGAEAAAAAKASAQDRLSRTSQAINSVKALQAQARANSQGASVPNGLVPGGLKVLEGPNARWTGANLPTQSGNKVTIQQNQEQAILHWETFNVGKDTELRFDQSAGKSEAGKWIAFNKIFDPTGRPSQILGSIKAEGQVYVLNQNGIVFGGSSQVNVRSLVVSSLPINDNLIDRGLLNNPDGQFLFTALALPAGTKGPTAAFTPPAPLTVDGSIGDVIVQKGAQITAATTAEKVGGRITLVGPNVRNEGSISTPDGQTILAAGLQVGFAAHTSSDATLRGLDIFVGSITYPNGLTLPVGTASNLGLIEAPRANVTMIGKSVKQLGIIESLTSTSLNGRVDLLADYGATFNTNYDSTKPELGPIFSNRITGTVELGAGSLIRIFPDLSGTEKVVGTQLSLPSLVNIQGKAIHFGAGSTLLAPGAILPKGSGAIVPVDASGSKLLAGVSVGAGQWHETALSVTARKFTGGQIYFDAGASINVAGSVDATAPISQNLLSLQLRGSELANSPLQRGGVLRGPSLTVDLRRAGIYNGFAWVGTPLGDVSGYVGIVQRGVGELTAAGGSVDLSAGESVIMQKGSEIDVSGGWINYEGGMVTTTRLLERGRLVDIADATPDRVYDGIYEGRSTKLHLKWGVAKTYANPLAMSNTHYEAGYVAGADSGTLTVNAPSMAMDGTLLGKAVQGPRQENSTTIALAKDGTLNMNFRAAETIGPAFVNYSPTPPKITFSNSLSLPAPDAFVVADDGTAQALRADRKANVIISPEALTANGFGNISIDNADGAVVLPQDTDFVLPLKGSITLRAANMSLDGSIIAPGGTVSLSVFDFSPFTTAKLKAPAPTPPSDLGRGIFALGAGAVLSTAGLIVDYRLNPEDGTEESPAITGGSITINAYTARLAEGSVIDVSGGLSISPSGQRSFGAGGSIAINAGRDPALTWLLGGQLQLGSTLKGYSGGKGGSLTIQAPLIQVGGSPMSQYGGVSIAAGELLHLTPDFFNQGGFTSFTLNGLGKAINAGNNQFIPAVTITANTVIRPVAQSWLPTSVANADSLTTFVKPEGVRTPVSLTFGSFTTQDTFSTPTLNVLRGDIVMESGARIETDPGASVTLSGSTVAVLGSIIAPGGKITIAGENAFPSYTSGSPLPGYNQALPTVHLGPRSVLSAAGKVVLTPDAYGRRIGSVLPGGTISVSGNIVAEAGAVLDVSGTSGFLDLAPSTLVEQITGFDAVTGDPIVSAMSGINAPLYRLATVPRRVDSDGGLIILKGGQELFTDATLRGFAGGATARGGSLAISSGRFIDTPGGVQPSPLDSNLVVTQTGLTLPTGFYPQGQTAIGHLVPVLAGDTSLGRGHFSVSSFLSGGFDGLKLSGVGSSSNQGAVEFSGPVSIAARRSLFISEGGVILADSNVYLEAPYVALGAAFKAPLLSSQSTDLSFSSYVMPTSGSGSITVRAALIDIGNLSLQNISQANFIADNGDIRGNGTLDVAGSIFLRAGQIYPTTASQFTIAAYDPNVVVATSATNTNQVTLASAALPPGFGIGSPLLGSTVTAINGNLVTLAANANATITGQTAVVYAPGAGSVTIAGSGRRQLPLSAGGTLKVFGSSITQGGTLVAPLGTITLGWDGTGASPIDYLTGAGITTGRSVPVTQKLTLTSGSLTSVSAVDPLTGREMLIPYGFSPDGLSWISPNGLDITSSGLPTKAVNLGALNLSHDSGALIDVRGAGDLYASRWVTGTGGTNDILGTASNPWDATVSYKAGQLVSYGGSTWSARQASFGSTPAINQDWTQIPASFAVIPDYQADFSPYAAFNNGTDPLNLALSDPGYVNSGLSVGDRVYLGASNGLAAGYYTLLPSRYALLPGGVLVTPQSTAARETILQPEGASLVAGYRFNSLDASQQRTVQATRFEVTPSAVLKARAQYDGFLANQFFAEAADNLGLAMPRLPQDSGRVVFSGLNALKIDGDVAGRAVGAGFDAEIDINTLADIRITGDGGTAPVGTVLLNAGKLSSFGAASLLIGGIRKTVAAGTQITVGTHNLTLDNAGSPLSGAEIILVAKDRLTLAPGTELVQSGISGSSGKSLLIGDSAVAGSGNGLLVRVSDQQAPIVRSGITSLAAQAALPVPPTLTIGAGALISGYALTLDSTYGTSLDPTAILDGEDIALNSGQISIAFDNAGVVPAIAGLMLNGSSLDVLKSASVLSLLSYSSIDLYGNGGLSTLGQLALRTAQIRGFNNGGGTVTFQAPEIVLDNSGGGIVLAAAGAPTGGLVFDAGTISLGTGQMKIDQIANVELQTTGGVLATGTGGLATQGSMKITAPVLTGTRLSNYSITAAGALDLVAPAGGASSTVVGGLGATLSLTGASLSANTDILLPSGAINLRATTGNLLVGNLAATRLDTGGTQQIFYDLIRYTDAGRVSLTADAGSVVLGAQSVVDVAAHADGGDAGTLAVSAANGTFASNGSTDASAGAGGQGGSFSLDVSALPNTSAIDLDLNAASFSHSRSYRVRTGNVTVDSLASVRSYQLSADQGSITVTSTGNIDASGATGGLIELQAFGDLVLQSGARLSVAGQDFNSAGQGGSIFLAAGSQHNGVVGTGVVDLQAGAVLDLSVASKVSFNPATDAITPGTSAYRGQFSGKLHIRAPQNAAGTDLLVNEIRSTITGASSILVEGYRLYDLTNTSGLITNTGTINAAGGLMTAANNVQGSINANGQAFLGANGTTTANYTAMMDRLLGADSQGLTSIFVLAPGAEIIKRNGDLTLGSSASTTTSDWNLSTFRYGAKGAAGVLTMRASGNLKFFNALSDGFTPTLGNGNAAWLYSAQLAAQNPLLPINTQSWSFRLSAGADLGAADFRRVLPLGTLAATAGSLQLGKLVSNANDGIPTSSGGSAAQTSTALAQRYQVIRTGSGSIDISAGRDVQLLNQFATIYTAGTRTADPTMGGNFQVPPSVNIGTAGNTNIGSQQQSPTYAAQYSMAGGNVSISAQNNIEHLTLSNAGVLVADSQKQIPNNWLYRRGYIDPATGRFGVSRDGDIASTSWWVDFSNFFQGVGALGGGNVSMIAGNNVSNVDAVVPTNARMTYKTSGGDLTVANQSMLELGGGDLSVITGGNIDAGIYYVERGQGTLQAGKSIITNSTRTASLGSLAAPDNIDPSPSQWLPTTLFLGKGGFDVSAAGDLLLGPTVNSFLLPVGINNSFWRKSYFSTYSATSELNVASLAGDVTLRQSSTVPGLMDLSPILLNWMQAIHLYTPTSNPEPLSNQQPWLRLAENNIQAFSTFFTLLPGTIKSTAFSGDINLVGTFNLSPSPVGTIELAAAGGINGLQPTGITSDPETGDYTNTIWSSAKINLSDADPSRIPGIYSPYGYQTVAGVSATAASRTSLNFLNFVNRLFAESGSIIGTQAAVQTQQALHGTGVLHANDSNPARLYAGGGNISGLTFFSSKSARILAETDITDIALYLQNTSDQDLSLVSAGRDIIAYNANSLLRVAAAAPDNLLNNGEIPLAGDIQINGPGTLAVLAGRNLDLGSGSNNADGTGTGLTSIGNARNPNLPFAGAAIIAGAGFGGVTDLTGGSLDYESFLSEVLDGPDGERYLAEIAEQYPDIGLSAGDTALGGLGENEKAKVALEIFFLVLRDAGRNHNLAGSAGFGNYDTGFAAISALFGEVTGEGDILTRSRDIRTKSGGSISLLAPGGGLTLANSTIGTTLVPPGIITEAGGAISIFTRDSVDIGISRIFTLRGGSQVIWSSTGDIAAGSSSKTVQSAPPTRVLIDPQTADLNVDLAGLATGGGIGVLATVEGVEPGSVDLIAPEGVVDAGDAGIQATGDLNIAAVQVLNADNISAGGTVGGVPTAPVVAAPNIGGLTSAANTSAATSSAATDLASAARKPPAEEESPSIIFVEVLGYGGGDENLGQL